MTTRSQLDEIEDMNIAITQIIHKGKHIEDVILLLEKRGATQGHIKTIIVRQFCLLAFYFQT